MSRLVARGLAAEVAGRVVFSGVDLALGAGEFAVLLGANGAGKSTLLRVLAGLLPAHAGRLELNGQPLASLGRRAIARQLAWVPQGHVPAFPFSVREWVTLGRLPSAGPWRRPSGEDREQVEQALTRMAVAHLAERPYTQLSGGERQRVRLARALAQAAPILLLDEPASHLDYGQQWRLLEHLRELAGEGYTVLAASHAPEQALACASRALALHQGRLVADGAPAEVLDAARVRQLYGVPLRQLDHPPYRFFAP